MIGILIDQNYASKSPPVGRSIVLALFAIVLGITVSKLEISSVMMAKPPILARPPNHPQTTEQSDSLPSVGCAASPGSGLLSVRVAPDPRTYLPSKIQIFK